MTVLLMSQESTTGAAVPTKIAHVGPSAGTTSITGLNYPASLVAGDLLLLWITYEGPASNVASISGWGSKVITASGGGVFTDLYVKTSAGTETGSVGTISITGGTASLASVIQYRSSIASFAPVTVATSGADESSGTAFSATTGAVTTIANDLICYCTGLNNTSTRSARTLTQAGATLGTLTAYFGAGTGLTQEAGDRPVTAGATAALVNTYTLGTASTGLFAAAVITEASASVTGTAAPAQASNTAVAVGVLGYSGTAAAGQASNTATAAGQLRYAGTAAASQAANTATASGSYAAAGFTGTAAATQAANTATAVGTLRYAGTASATQAANTATAVGKLGYTGTAAPAQASNVASATGKLGYAGTATPSQAGQTSTAVGKLVYTGTAASPQAPNTASAVGTSGPPGASGSAAAAQASQTAVAVGVLRYIGTAAAAQGGNLAAATGILRYAGSAATSQEGDTATATGLAFVPIFGTAALSQAHQTATATGVALGKTVARPTAGVTTRPVGLTNRPLTGTTQRP